MCVCNWNITLRRDKDQEIIQEILDNGIEICAVNETKKKNKGKVKFGKNVFIYSAVSPTLHGKSGVGILIHEKLEPNIE